MPDLFRDEEAAAFAAQFADAGEDVALRVYTSRLLGRDRSLVLHGGGNTSVKTTKKDLLGRDVEVLCVKGSGWDLVDIEPPGLPAVRLAALRELRALDSLSDEDMVNGVRGALLDSRAPNPSVEALLHAFLPHAYVDHTHADAILTLTDQPDPERHVRAALGDDVLVLPWIMPGFPLAKAVADAYERAPSCVGIVLAKHGLFTFGATAAESYRRTVDLVDRAQAYVDAQVRCASSASSSAARPRPEASRVAALAAALPALRGACAATSAGGLARVVADARLDDDLAAFGERPDAAALCATNPITPDHVIRTKGPYLHLTADEWADPARVRRRVEDYARAYRDYYERSARRISPSHMHAPAPVVAVLAGVGVVALHASRKGARIAADIAEHTLRVKARAQALGRYVALDDDALAEMEYWPLELSKLGKGGASPELQGQVALVTGAAGAIGVGVCEVLLERGACVLATDVDADGLQRAQVRLGGGERLRTVVCDLTKEAAAARMFDACCAHFGGVDCVVPNAGVAHVSSIEEMDHATFRRVLDVNATATMAVLQQAAAVFRAQGTGGSVVLQASKNVFAPGARFGAYSASKAAALQLGRVAAMEFAELQVRVNMVNADAVFGDEDAPSRLWAEVGPDRMKARGLDEAQLRDYYRERSLLKQPVTPRHVGEAVAWFAAQRTPTTGAVLPVDGGLPEAFPR
jgi:rhamnose utilization protein RhaD (predicted bifunctional aldolase and dehydrogenase)/NAD(P)-dependent dehydrogenase (short-subunit alcohol dehydrogenase family)